MSLGARIGLSGLLAAAVLALPLAVAAPPRTAKSAPTATAARADGKTVIAIRRMTGSQYRHTIADVFGPDIKVEGRFEPDTRKDGLLAIGASQLSISAAGFAQYFAMARSIADQALAETARERVVPCKPASATAADAACAETFFKSYGSALLRRNISKSELKTALDLSAAGAKENKDFYAGLKLGLISILASPEFLFRIELAEPDPAKRGAQRIDADTAASRLSFLIWDAPPDAELRRAAAAGELYTTAGVQKQVNRLVGDTKRVEVGLRAFFEDMLMFEKFETLTKDGMTYPKFSAAVADSAREQTLRFLIDQLVVKNGDYRNVFTSQETWMNRTLAGVYDVPFTFNEEWVRYSFPESAGYSGLLTQTTFMSLFSHPGRSSPTLRGIGIREMFMCQPIPLPPADVDFSKVRDSTSNTVRDRLLEHATNAGCSVCHNVMDPPGLALEHFDGLGRPQLVENGKPIDVSSQLDGEKMEGAQGLGRALASNPRVPECLVNKVYAYGMGRAPDRVEDPFIKARAKAFADGGYSVRKLLVDVASSPEFMAVKPGAVATAVAATSSKTVAYDPAAGAKAYARVCAGCHGVDGAGGVAPKLTGLTDAVSIGKQVRDGGGRMPPMGALLSEDEVAHVAQYVAAGIKPN